MSSVPAAPSDQTAPRVRKGRRVFYAVVTALLVALVVYVATIQDFLSLNQPVHGEILVVESWYAPMPTLLDAVAAIKGGQYRKVVCVAVDEMTPSDAATGSAAQRAADFLIRQGIEPTLLHVADVPVVETHRTFSSAMAVRQWLQREIPGAASIDVFTKSIHARKSFLIYRKVFPESIRVGVIAGTAEPFPRNHWWLSTGGVYLIVRNTIGWLYAACVAPPSDNGLS